MKHRVNADTFHYIVAISIL